MLDVQISLPVQRAETPAPSGWKTYLPEDTQVRSLVTQSIEQAIREEDLDEAEITADDVAIYAEVWATHLLEDLQPI